MPKFRFERTVSATPERCYDVFTDLASTTAHVEDITEINVLTDQPFGVGTRFTCTRIMFGKPYTEEMTVEAAEPGKQYALGCASCGSRFETTYTFTREGAGTRIVQTCVCTPQTLMSKLMSPLGVLFAGGAKKAMNKDLDQLVAVCETHS